MNVIKQIDVLIVGSGPAGMSTALHLVKEDADWAKRIVVVDKAVHPREKLCGGGITRLGADVLTALGLDFEPSHIPVQEVRLIYEQYVYAFRGNPAFRVVRRAEFDHWLVQQGEQRGITVCQGEGIVAITPRQNYVEVCTEHTTFQAQVVVAADGSRSFIRQKLKWDEGHPTKHTGNKRMARLLEILTPETDEGQASATENEAFSKGIAIFDFSQMKQGLQGYYWDFPSLIQGQPFMNRGVFDSRIQANRPRVALKDVLQNSLRERERDLADYPLKGHPIHWFTKHGRFAQPRVLLAGDAAGVDPLLGEGIPFALAYGEVAAAEIVQAFSQQEFGFSTYKARILRHPTLSQLVLRTYLARFVYALRAEWLIRLGWRFLRWGVRVLVLYNRSAILVDPPLPEKIEGESRR